MPSPQRSNTEGVLDVRLITLISLDRQQHSSVRDQGARLANQVLKIYMLKDLVVKAEDKSGGKPGWACSEAQHGYA